MGMYPPGQQPIKQKDTIPIVPMGEIPPEMKLGASPEKQGQKQHENLKNGNRNIQAKRLSSQTHIQRTQ